MGSTVISGWTRLGVIGKMAIDEGGIPQIPNWETDEYIVIKYSIWWRFWKVTSSIVNLVLEKRNNEAPHAFPGHAPLANNPMCSSTWQCLVLVWFGIQQLDLTDLLIPQLMCTCGISERCSYFILHFFTSSTTREEMHGWSPTMILVDSLQQQAHPLSKRRRSMMMVWSPS